MTASLERDGWFSTNSAGNCGREGADLPDELHLNDWTTVQDFLCKTLYGEEMQWVLG